MNESVIKNKTGIPNERITALSVSGLEYKIPRNYAKTTSKNPPSGTVYYTALCQNNVHAERARGTQVRIS